MDPRDFAAPEAAWMRALQSCDSPVCDVFIRLADSVYVGPQNGMTPAQWRDERIPLPTPALPCRLPGRVATAELLGREAVLATHYAALASILTAHGRAAELSHPFPYFTLQPAVLCGDTVLAGWPWSDSLPEAAATLERLAQAGRAAPGTVLLDEEDQGWRLLIVAGAERLQLVEWDGEGPPPISGGWQVPTLTLAQQAAEALHRLHAVRTGLRRHLGYDPWP
jgi:hypothetical protein